MSEFENQPHTDSYYAATANDHTDYPRLEGEVRADVCVIGGGFSGISTALTLAERGYSVDLVEQNKIGWGASGRNGGQMIGGTAGDDHLNRKLSPDYADMIWDIGYRGNEIIEERVEKYAIQCDLKHGYIETAYKPRHMRYFEAHYEELQRRGFGDKVRMVPRNEIEETVGSKVYIGGLINNRNGHIHPLNLCIGEARAAEKLGVSIFENSSVTEIVHGEKPLVKTSAGQIVADKVVVTGNAYNRLEQKRIKGQVFPAGSYIIATEPLSEEEARQINPLDMAIGDLNTVVDYYRLSADRRLLFGGRCNYSGREPKSIRAWIEPRMLKVYPQLKGKRIDYEWGGNVGIIVNRVPLLGRIEPNVFYAMGYSGHGVNVSHVAGEIMADAVAGTFERLDVFEKISHINIPFGQRMGGQLVALGMLYYRMKDLL
jgi:gamma-glutamylputrescine oxidase